MDRLDQHFILNGRWQFNAIDSTLTDLQDPAARLRLKPVAARIFALLVASPQTLLRRQQLIDEGWRRFGFEVCENALNQVMSALRTSFEALGPGRPIIKTVPRIGYCLLANVEPSLSSSRYASAAGDSASSGKAPRASILDRDHFDDRVEHEWGRIRNGVVLSLLLIGLDAYVSSRVPIEESEALMNRVTQLLVQYPRRAADCTTRYDKLTIAILLTHTEPDGARHVAGQLEQAILNGAFSGAVKIGIACSTQIAHTDTFEALMQIARATMSGPLTHSSCEPKTDAFAIALTVNQP